MVLWVSSCHGATLCKLLDLQSAELKPSVINQTLRQCETHEMYFWIFCCLLTEVLTPPPYQQITPTESQGGSDEAHTVLGFGGELCERGVYVLCVFAPEFVCILARVDGN